MPRCMPKSLGPEGLASGTGSGLGFARLSSAWIGVRRKYVRSAGRAGAAGRGSSCAAPGPGVSGSGGEAVGENGLVGLVTSQAVAKVESKALVKTCASLTGCGAGRLRLVAMPSSKSCSRNSSPPRGMHSAREIGESKSDSSSCKVGWKNP